MNRGKKDYKNRRAEVQAFVDAGLSNPQIAERLGTTRQVIGWLLVHLDIYRTAEQRKTALSHRRPRIDGEAARARRASTVAKRGYRLRVERQQDIKRLVRKSVASLSDSALDAIEAIVRQELAA